MLIPEFAPQSGIALTWPHELTDWHHSLNDITPVYLAIARAVMAYEKLLIICYDEAHRTSVMAALAAADLPADRVIFASVPFNDTWIRDYGPLVTGRHNQVMLHDFTFDGWNGKYPASLDNEVTQALRATGFFAELPCRQHALVLEGGSIDTDGCGTLLTTSRCLLDTSRNPGIGRKKMELALRSVLGIERVLWLEHGEIIGDDTDGHIDMLARFCSPETIAYTCCNDVDDPHYPSLNAMETQLRSFTTTSGKPYRLAPLPLPAACYNEDNQQLPASYANFLLLNNAVLMPNYRDPADITAQQILQDCFPERRIIPIDCRPLIQQHGSLHCATLQFPAGVLM